MKLQRQYLFPLKIFMVLEDVCILFLAVLFSYLNAWEELAGMGPGAVLLLTLVVGFHILLLMAHTLPVSLRKLPQSVLASINEECMTGLQCGNAVLCDSGYLLIIGARIKAIMPQNIDWVRQDKIGRGQIVALADKSGVLYRIMSPASSAKGNGTFCQVDIDTFYKELEEVISQAQPQFQSQQ